MPLQQPDLTQDSAKQALAKIYAGQQELDTATGGAAVITEPDLDVANAELWADGIDVCYANHVALNAQLGTPASITQPDGSAAGANHTFTQAFGFLHANSVAIEAEAAVPEYLDVSNFETYANSQGYTESQVENKLWNLGYTALDGSDLEADLIAGNALTKAAFDAASDTI